MKKWMKKIFRQEDTVVYDEYDVDEAGLQAALESFRAAAVIRGEVEENGELTFTVLE